MTKKVSKSSKHKNAKIDKIIKSEKVSKTRKWKSDKMIKLRKWKSDKKQWKIDPLSKWPKCQINGQNRHFVKSEPPGWALFEFQGVPRDPVLRPKSTWGVADGEFLHFFVICTFYNLSFWCFLSFKWSDKFHIFEEVTFLRWLILHYNKALW